MPLTKYSIFLDVVQNVYFEEVAAALSCTRARQALPLPLDNSANAVATNHRILWTFLTKCVSITRVPGTWQHSGQYEPAVSSSLCFQAPMHCIAFLAMLSILAKWFSCSACYIQVTPSFSSPFPLRSRLLPMPLATLSCTLSRWLCHVPVFCSTEDLEEIREVKSVCPLWLKEHMILPTWLSNGSFFYLGPSLVISHYITCIALEQRLSVLSTLSVKIAAWLCNLKKIISILFIKT